MAVSAKQAREDSLRSMRTVNWMRIAILTHRWLGIAVGVVVSAWCLSAFVMMYVQYPELTDAERVTVLDPIAFPPAAGDSRFRIPDYPGRVDRLRIEMLGGRPVLRLFGDAGQRVFDYASGGLLNGLDATAAGAVSRRFAERAGLDAGFMHLGRIDRDQWTVYASYHPHRPLHHFAAGDAAGTEWYVSGPTGEVVQVTTAHERFWNWIGAVTHWIYFTSFRQHTAVWAQTVVWLTIVASFLTVLGIYIGIKRLKRRRNGRPSPYRGWALWHHVTGLAFGLFVLTWLVSGLFSMNPWGAFEGRSFATERLRLEGSRLDPGLTRDALDRLPRTALPAGTVRIDSATIGGRPAWIATTGDGARIRLDGTSLAPRPLDTGAFTAAAARMRPAVDVEHQGWLDRDDAYYYSHHESVALPVYRIVYADGERYYLDAASGALLRAFDTSRRWYRWAFEALHRGDFARIARMRPIWDAFMLPLLLGVTIIALSGTWLGMQRLRRSTATRRKFRSSRPTSGRFVV